MPYIETKTTAKISPEQEAAIRAELGKAIELIRGKSEQWLMLSFFDECRMAFQGTTDPDIAIVEVKIFGSAKESEYNALTARITEILTNHLAIQPYRIYVKYDEVDTWGYAGENF